MCMYVRVYRSMRLCSIISCIPDVVCVCYFSTCPTCPHLPLLSAGAFQPSGPAMRYPLLTAQVTPSFDLPPPDSPSNLTPPSPNEFENSYTSIGPDSMLQPPHIPSSHPPSPLPSTGQLIRALLPHDQRTTVSHFKVKCTQFYTPVLYLFTVR